MNEREKERMLADCLEEYHRRRALGVVVEPGQFEDRLGEIYPEFVEIVEAEVALDEIVEPKPPTRSFPRAFGDYTLLGELGGGAMGVVYEAIHRDLGRTVALKILRTGFDTEAKALERFRREARACAQVRHDHIVEIYEAGEVDGRPFYAMPLLPGRSLGQLIKDGEVPEPASLARNLAGVADALETLHRAGIVHRDVKPANIMVAPDGTMTLADFGLAKTTMTQTLTQTGQAMGTPLYMSPEQALGKKDEVDGRSDVYAIGATLYEALGGRPPYQAKSFHDLLRLIVTERPKPLSAVAPDAPKDLARVAMKAIESRRKDRYQTAAELRDDLLSFAQGERPAGKPVSRLRHGYRRYRLRMAIAAAVLLALVVGAGLYMNRPGTLEVFCAPAAAASIDGVLVGETLLETPVSKGAHTITLEAERFQPLTVPFEMEAGTRFKMKEFLVPLDDNDEIARGMLADAMKLKLEKYSVGSGWRGGAEGITLSYPHGAVRIADLTAYRADIHPESDYEDDGTLEFRRGDEVLLSRPFSPRMSWEIAAVPSAVLDALSVGDVVTWGVWPAEGEPVTAEFRVVGPEVEGLAELEKMLERQSETTSRHFRAQLYLDQGLFTAAIHEAGKILDGGVESARALAVIQTALERLGANESWLWANVQKRIVKLSPEAKQHVFQVDEDE